MCLFERSLRARVLHDRWQDTKLQTTFVFHSQIQAMISRIECVSQSELRLCQGNQKGKLFFNCFLSSKTLKVRRRFFFHPVHEREIQVPITMVFEILVQSTIIDLIKKSRKVKPQWL